MLEIEHFDTQRFVPPCLTLNFHRQCCQTPIPSREWPPEENQVQECTRHASRAFDKRQEPFFSLRNAALIPSRSELRRFPRVLTSQPLPMGSNGRQSRSQTVSKEFGIDKRRYLEKRRIQRERSVVAGVLGLFRNTKKISAGLANNPSSLRREEIKQMDNQTRSTIEPG